MNTSQQRWTRIDPEDGTTRLGPSPSQKELWGNLITGDPDPHGWYNGWCPVIDPGGSDPTRPSAQFNFLAGAFRCLHEPKCHDRRSTSLNNLLVLLSRTRSE
jgi:hypothetical protein